MLVKIIIVLILTIAVGVLGFSDIGEGVFNFVDKSAAAEYAEDARDLTQIVEIYSTDQQGGQTAFGGTADVAVTTVDLITLPQVSTFLQDDVNGDFLKKALPTQYTLLADADSAYLRFGEVVGDELGADVCAEINEIATGDDAVAPTAIAYGIDNASLLAALRVADIDDLEMLCVEDSGNVGTFNAFYRLGSAL